VLCTFDGTDAYHINATGCQKVYVRPASQRLRLVTMSMFGFRPQSAGLSEVGLCPSFGPLEIGDSKVTASPCAWTAPSHSAAHDNGEATNAVQIPSSILCHGCVAPLSPSLTDGFRSGQRQHGQHTMISLQYVPPLWLEGRSESCQAGFLHVVHVTGQHPVQFANISSHVDRAIRQVAEAVCLEQLSYHEAWELSYFGANVLHPRTTLPAMKFRCAAAASSRDAHLP